MAKMKDLNGEIILEGPMSSQGSSGEGGRGQSGTGNRLRNAGGL